MTDAHRSALLHAQRQSTTRFIVFSGLPCTGKSSIADAVGRQLGVPVFAKDWIEAALRRSQVGPDERSGIGSTGYAAYELLTVLAEHQLRLDQSLILDSVATTASIRATWRDLADRHGAAWFVIECVCSDVVEHRARIDRRERGIPGWYEPRWPDVERIASGFASWQEPRLVLDAIDRLDDNIARAMAYVAGGGEGSVDPGSWAG